MFEIVITADTNDADYITAINDITQENIDRLIPVIQAIKTWGEENKYGHNFPHSEYSRESVWKQYSHISEEEMEFFLNYTPYGENGIHTIESIDYYIKPVKINLL